jgi:hypothetical protein
MRRILRLGPIFAPLLLTALACNLSGGADTSATETASAQQTALADALGTALAETVQVASPTAGTPTEAGTATVTATASVTPILTPFITTTVNSNVRGGPGTVYDVLGNLLEGQSADILGRNSAGTWWVIAFAPGPGGQGWIANSIVTVSGDTSNVPIVAAPPTPTPEPSGWEGTWSTNCGGSDCGDMVLTVSGDDVTGVYADGDGTITGEIDDNHLTGSWHRGGDAGDLDFWLTGNGEQFRGNWDSVYGWCGHREGSNDPSPCAVSSWYGTWTTNCGLAACGTMILSQDGTSVEGTYANGDGSINGDVSGAVLDGTWSRNNSSGSIKFYLLVLGAQFNGNYDDDFPWCGYMGGAGMPGVCYAP